MQFLSLAILFAPLVSSLAVVAPRPSTQKVLVQEPFNNSLLEKVPGDNPAYFTRVPKDEQSFWIGDFTVSPYPPVEYDKNTPSHFHLSVQLMHSQRPPHLLLLGRLHI